MKHTVSKSVLAGAVGGLFAAFVMNQFQSLLATATKKLAKQRGEQQQTDDGGDDATVKTANTVARPLLHRELTSAEKRWAGPVVHYAFGVLVGAVYGYLVRTAPHAGDGRGTLYGSAVWLAADEISVPAFGLGPPPLQTPPGSHIKALASHLVYGFTTDLITRTLGPRRPTNGY
jgi:putative membrane protein